jgi:hypothetical protein
MKSFSQIYFSQSVDLYDVYGVIVGHAFQQKNSSDDIHGEGGGCDGENISAVEALGVHQWLLKLRNVMKRVAYC